jgi:hypothetical protein
MRGNPHARFGVGDLTNKVITMIIIGQDYYAPIRLRKANHIDMVIYDDDLGNHTLVLKHGAYDQILPEVIYEGSLANCEKIKTYVEDRIAKATNGHDEHRIDIIDAFSDKHT